MSDIPPNTPEALVAAVLKRLKTEFDDLTVAPYPDRPESYQLKHPTGVLLVRYTDSRYGPSLDTRVVQERRMALEVTLYLRALRGDGGVDTVLERLRLNLTGYAPDGFDKLRPLRDGFVDENNGLWRYAMDFETGTTVIEGIEAFEEDGTPRAVKVTLRDADGQVLREITGDDAQ
uniref:Gp37 protein n=1 Tax=Candidatus Kentrum eta TaxID=2126337 RepID=A0A450VPX4_9GAMM|nr:MAG: Gp37 protein [Candidatus Kentron sp. H]VFK04439.1 MAG: Gp37 protein [Candidatus Kentron sp. H]VFK06827.1 MAG: Gp37 protein [Candidatus Kentron sp. H]